MFWRVRFNLRRMLSVSSCTDFFARFRESTFGEGSFQVHDQFLLVVTSPQSSAVYVVTVGFQLAAHAMSEFMYRSFLRQVLQSQANDEWSRDARPVRGLSRYTTNFCWSSFRSIDFGKPATFNLPNALVGGS